MRYEDASGTFQASGPIANDDSDTLTAGSRGPATGNVITGEGTQFGSAGADSAAGAQVTALAGKGGEDTSFAGGKLSVAGEFGQLSVDAQGNYTYLANAGAPENVRDRFTYTLADNQGNSDTAALIVEIGKTPVVIKADAQQIVPGPDGVVTLPAGVELSDIMVVGRNLVVNMPDGTQLIIVDGAVFVPQLVLGGVEVPATNVAALLIGQEVQPAAGETPPSGGGNFALPPPPLDPGVPLGDLIPPTEYNYIPPEPQEVLDILDREPEIFVQPDGQPASVAAVDQVEEAGLPGPRLDGASEPPGSGEGSDGNGADDDVGTETTIGTIIINSPDGVDSVTINGQLVTGLAGQQIAGAFGTLTITGFSGDDILYSYTLNDNTSGNDTHDDFSVVLTDDDGDQAAATLRIDIIDDVPTARNDTDVSVNGVATGNVMTDAAAGDVGDSDTNAADTVGADNATLTAVSGTGGSDSTFSEGLLNVNGSFGSLTIDAQGNYTYTVNPNAGGGGVDVFTYTLTDGDGDTTTATLTITNPDLTPNLPDPELIRLDDDVIPGAGGNPDGPDDDDPDVVGENSVNGQLVGSGGDGDLDYAFSGTNTLPTGFTVNVVNAGQVQILQGATVVMTITLDTETGAFTVVQNAPIDHPSLDGLDGDNTENNLDFSIGVRVVDVDGDAEPAAITINVDDDTPVVTVELDREGAVTVDESGPTGASTITFGGGVTKGNDGDVDGSGPIGRAVGSTAVVDANALFGADGPLGGTGLTYALALGGTDTPLTLTDGSAIELQLIDGVIVGVVTEGPHDGQAAFAIAINPTTGVATVELYLSLDHPDVSNPNDSLPLGPNTVDVVVSATDGDNDTVGSDPVDISGLFNFLDDGPTAGGTANPAGAVTVDESGPTSASTIEFTGDEGDDLDVAGSGPIGRAVGVAAVVDGSAAFGADGPAADASLSYSLALGGSDTPLTLTDGSAIELQLIDGVIVGMVTEGAHDGEAAFAIAINPSTGVATVELYLSLDHPDMTDPNDSLPLGPNTVDVIVTATDGDGDMDESDPVDISGLFNFLDDGPSVEAEVDPQAAVTVDESGPTSASTIEFTGDEGDDLDVPGSGPIGRAVGGTAVVNANALFGADGEGVPSDLSYALALGGSDTALTLTDGSAIELQLIDGVIVGVVTEGPHDGDAAFAIAIDPSTGVATVEMYLSLDHPDMTDHNDSLPLGPNTIDVVVSATDGDGDSVDSDPVDISGLFNFLDDGPSVSATLSTGAAAVVDESEPVAAPAINTGPYTIANDPHLEGGFAIGSGSTTGAVINANAAFGADGPAADPADLSYNLVILNASSGLTTTEGNPINLVQLPSGVVVGVVASGTFAGQAAFAISINSATGVVTVEQYLSLDHPIFPNDFDEPVFLDEDVLGATVTATDGDGDTDTSDAVDIGSKIRFEDDGPNASDEPQQNVQEGNQTVSGTFDFVGGADGASVTHINDIVLTFAGDGWSQWIPVDDGQIRAQADGDYQFQSDASGSGVTGGTFTVTDGDGDQDKGNWAFNITDANAPTAGVSAARLDDDGLSGGNPLSTTGDIDANVGERLGEENPEEDIFNGQLTLNFGGDGPGSVTFAAMDGQPGVVGTENVIYHWVGNTLTAEIDGGPRDGGTLFTLVLDTATGEYTLTLNDNVIHAAGGDETSAPNVALTYTVTDSDNSPAGGVNGTLNITFNDDAPTVSNVQGGGSVTLDETTAGTPAGFPIDATSLTAVITATKAFGADGPAAVGDTVYGLSLANGATIGTTLASGLQTAIGNLPITLTLTSATTITGTYTDGGTQTAFTITMNSDGTLTVEQNVPLEHLVDGSSAAAHDDSLDLVLDGGALTNLVNATITIKDGDGDTHSGSTPIGDQIIFKDDGPDAATSATAVGTVTLDETRPEGTDTAGGLPNGDASATIDFSVNFVSGGSVDYGADGPGSVAYALVLTGTNVNSGLFALDSTDTETVIDGYGQGAQIVLNISGNTVTGSVGATNYFTLIIDPATGVVTFTQLLPIWHPTPGTASFDESATLTTLAANLLQVVQTVTDSDGDTDTASINIGQGVFNIQDDGPQAIQPDAATLENEAGATSGPIDLDDDSEVITDFGEDGPGLVRFANITNGQDSTLDSGGVNITYWLSNNGQTLQGRTNSTNGTDGQLIFTVQINQASGDYTVTMTGTIDNGAGVTFNNLTSTKAGNVDVRGVGADDPLTTVDLLLTASKDGANSTINTDSDSIGSDNQSMDDGETVRIDFVTNLEANAGLPSGFSYDGHVGTNSLLQAIPQVQGSESETVAFRVYALNTTVTDAAMPDDTPGNGFSDSTIVNTITHVTVDGYDVGEGSVTVVLGAVGVWTTIAHGVSAQRQADGSVIFTGVQQGDQYGITTTTDFNAFAVTALGAGVGPNAANDSSTNSFDLGVFSIGQVDTGEPINISFDLSITDADGDTIVMPGAMDITFEPATESLALNPFSSQDEQLQKQAANSNTLTMAAAVAAAGMAESAAASPPADDQSFDAESESSAGTQQVATVLADDGGDDGGSAVSGLPETSEAEAPGNSGGHSRADEHRSDNSLDASTNQQSSDEGSSHQAANDQGPANEAAAANAVAPTVGMPSAEALLAAGLTGETAKHTGQVEEILADALGQGGAPTVDGLLAHLSGGLGELAAISNVASPAAGAVPGWDMAMHGGSGFAADVLTKLDATMLQHHDAVQPAVNG